MLSSILISQLTQTPLHWNHPPLSSLRNQQISCLIFFLTYWLYSVQLTILIIFTISQLHSVFLTMLLTGFSVIFIITLSLSRSLLMTTFPHILSLSCGVLQGSVLGSLLFNLYTTTLSILVALSSLSHHLYDHNNQLFISFSELSG